MGRDHSCYGCGNGGFANDLPCECIEQTEAVRLLGDGFDADATEHHPACVRFHLPAGVLTYWKGDDMGGDNWTLSPTEGRSSDD